jgi:protein TonB
LNSNAFREEPLGVSIVGSEPVEPTSGRKSFSLLKLLAWLLAIIIVGTVAITAVVGLRSANRLGAPAPVPEVKEAYETPLGLKVASSAGRLDVSWDHDSPVILTGTRAVLTITDGDITKRIQLDEKQMRDGSIAYTPFSTDVNLRLEVGGPDGKTIGESVRVIANDVAPFDNADPLHVLRAGSQSDVPTLRNGGLVSMLRKDRGAKHTAEPVDQATERYRAAAKPARESNALPTKNVSAPLSLPQNNADPNGVSIEPPPSIGVAPAQTDASLAQMQISAGPPPAAGHATSEQAPQSASTTTTSKPVTSPPPPQVVAPQVVHRVTPALARDQFPKDRRVEITVVARINAQGTVWNASLAEDSTSADAQLAAAAIAAARKWKFQPATINGKKVSSEIELHFRFGLDLSRP